MIGVQGKKELMLPASRWFILLSFVVALVLNLIPFGKPLWRPDLVAVVLVFWCVWQPKHIYFTFIFSLGLIMDTHQGVLLGEHALAYTVTSLLAVLGSRRIAWFNIPGQMLHVFPLFMILHLVDITIHFVSGDPWPGWKLFLAPVVETLLWPIAYLILQMPQHRIRG